MIDARLGLLPVERFWLGLREVLRLQPRPAARGIVIPTSTGDVYDKTTYGNATYGAHFEHKHECVGTLKEGQGGNECSTWQPINIVNIVYASGLCAI